MVQTLTRRALAGSAAFSLVPRHVLGGPGYTPPSDKLNIAGVGVGGMGSVYLQNCESENIVALCDVDSRVASKTFARYPKAAAYRDYRVMLEKEKGIDAVVIGTPDHTHAAVAMAAMRLRKHVYCAKPMARTLHEARRMADAAREYRVATQMSVQSSASEDASAAVEILQSGAIGPVHEAHVWNDRPVWPQGVRRPATAEPVPDHLDWDLWLGPAPARPYHSAYHPFNWRGWYDFGTGALGDMALHSFHVVFRALQLGVPARVSSSAAVFVEPAPEGQSDPAWTRIRRAKTPETFPLASMVTWEFPARQELPPLRLFWYDGGLRPPCPAHAEGPRSLPPDGMYFVGDRGTLLMRGPGSDPKGSSIWKGLLPLAKYRDYTPPVKTLARTIGHYQEWIAAAKGGAPATCSFEFSRRMTETALLGAISQRTGKTLDWDDGASRIANDSEAQQLVNPPYRSGWSL